MRQPKFLSHSSLSLWAKDRQEFFLRYLADIRAPRLVQERYMSIGSAFDAYAKSALHEALFGKGADPQFEFDAIFCNQVEEHNRDWARENGLYVFDCYRHTGFYDELLAMLAKSKEPPRFEFSLEGEIDGVPLMGKPDCRFVHECGVHVILDWKVKGYCSAYGASPSKNYRLCRDGYDAVALGVGRTKARPEGKQSISHGRAHNGYLAYDHHGLEINAAYMEAGNDEYADQLSMYGWLLGEQPGDENVVVVIDEIVGKYTGPDSPPLLRVANHRARVSAAHQQALLERAKQCWASIASGHVFTDLSREESDARCEQLQGVSVALQSDGTTLGDYYSEVARPQRR